MRVTTLRTVAVVVLVVLAGCSGLVSQGDGATTTPADATAESTANQGYSVTVVSQTSGEDGVNFYVSDEENVIDDFRHLNVTITRVGFQRAGDGNDSEGGWVERDVDNRSVDLTRLKGANATRLTNVDAPNGSYEKTFAYVGDVNATLTSGEQVRVKLPSEKLQIKKPFTVGDGEAIDFVFDIAVHKAGNSGKYILKPVVGESGTDVPIESVDEDDEREGALDVAFVGNVTRGGTATLEVTRNGSAVENATVSVDDGDTATTDADGRVTVALPDDDEVEIEVTHGDAETELELEFEEADAEAEDEDEADDEEETEEAEEEETEDEEEPEDEEETEETDEEEDEEETEDETETDDETETTETTEN